jgi:hypothetical protein
MPTRTSSLAKSTRKKPLRASTPGLMVPAKKKLLEPKRLSSSRLGEAEASEVDGF